MFPFNHFYFLKLLLVCMCMLSVMCVCVCDLSPEHIGIFQNKKDTSI